MRYFECQEAGCGKVCSEKTAVVAAFGVQPGVNVLKCPYCRGKLHKVSVFRSRFISKKHIDEIPESDQTGQSVPSL